MQKIRESTEKRGRISTEENHQKIKAPELKN